MNHLVKSTLKNVARNYGVHVRYMPRLMNKGPEYEVVLPDATYSPWNLDEGFKTAYSRVQHATLVDKYRCFELWRLVEQCAKLEGGALIEIGVWRGGTAALIAIQAKDLGLRDKVYACDTFSGVVKAGAEDPSYLGGEHADTSQRSVEELFYDTLNLDNIEVLDGYLPRGNRRPGREPQVQILSYRRGRLSVSKGCDGMDLGTVGPRRHGRLRRLWLVTQLRASPAMSTRNCRSRTGLVLHNLNGHAIVIKR